MADVVPIVRSEHVDVIATARNVSVARVLLSAQPLRFVPVAATARRTEQPPVASTRHVTGTPDGAAGQWRSRSASTLIATNAALAESIAYAFTYRRTQFDGESLASDEPEHHPANHDRSRADHESDRQHLQDMHDIHSRLQIASAQRPATEYRNTFVATPGSPRSHYRRTTAGAMGGAAPARRQDGCAVRARRRCRLGCCRVRDRLTTTRSRRG